MNVPWLDQHSIGVVFLRTALRKWLEASTTIDSYICFKLMETIRSQSHGVEGYMGRWTTMITMIVSCSNIPCIRLTTRIWLQSSKIAPLKTSRKSFPYPRSSNQARHQTCQRCSSQAFHQRLLLAPKSHWNCKSQSHWSFKSDWISFLACYKAGHPSRSHFQFDQVNFQMNTRA